MQFRYLLLNLQDQSIDLGEKRSVADVFER